ncbi:MAG: SRPBCC domain-containing protein [Ignavibacteriae bacterium]|nr:SRPBCC domain-containing protein [Ignavibacteria bacterium]MBI3365672.1 SRPBCC domain-containing protein [Ignavibacteriota bacterium]
MATPTTETTLIIKRTFNAPRAKVFEAWTTPEQLKQWFSPSDNYLIPIATVDLKVGGTYRIGMRPQDRETLHVATGVYREIRPPEKLVFTWSWEGEPMETLVTVEFRDLGNETEVMLKHENFSDDATRDKHSEGWTGCMTRLARTLQKT